MAEKLKEKSRWLRWVLRALVAILLIAGAAYMALLWMLPSAITAAPNTGRRIDPQGDPSGESLRALGVSQHLRVAVAKPPASLSLFVIDPPRRDIAGTVIVFHGIRDSKRSMLGVGRRLAATGYRAVLLDNRGHGHSSGDVLSFGVFERDDAEAVLDALEARKLLKRPVGALGFSYGGSVAIQLASRDARVAAVVSVSTFSSLRAVVKNYVRVFAPGVGRLLSDARIDRAVEEAAKAGGFDPDEADTAAAAARLKVPLLVMHGARDLKIPVSHSRTICEAAGKRCRRVVAAREGHDSMLGGNVVWREAQAFFARALRGP